MLNDYAIYPIRSAAILTGSYVAGTILGPTNGAPAARNQLIIYADFTIGSLTDGQIKVEFSHDGTTYFQESFSSISTVLDTVSLGTHKFTATGKYRIAIPIKDNYIKISVIGTGTATSSTMTITAVLGNV